MPNQNPGDTLWMEATMKNGNSPLTPDSQTVTLIGPNCNQTSDTIVKTGSGKYKAKISIPKTGRPGLYTIAWTVIADGDQETEKHYFVVH